MSRYLFGLHPFHVDQQLEERIQAAQDAQAVHDLAAELIEESGPHVLPHLSGDETCLKTVRERHLRWLKRVFSTQDLVNSLQEELKLFTPVLRRPPDEEIAADGGSEIYEGECWWWICEDIDYDGVPEYCYWEEWCDPFSGEPYDETKCQEFGPDGEVHETDCLGDEFLCV